MRRLKLISSAAALITVTAAAFSQQSGIANSVWNGGTGVWTYSDNWTTNGVTASTTPNNGDMTLCTIGGVSQSCAGFFNVTVGSGGNDLVTLDSLPITIDSLVLGASTGSAALDIGSAVADTLTIGDPTAQSEYRGGRRHGDEQQHS